MRSLKESILSNAKVGKFEEWTAFKRENAHPKRQIELRNIIKQAIEDAKENARINNVDNIEFMCGDVEIVLDKLVNKDKIKPTAIFVDPPRKGLDNKTVENISKVKPKKIVYISCNPATMVRDMKILSEKYEIGNIQPVDMFPFTSHVECVAVLYLKQDM